MIQHDHGLSARDELIVRSNWERVEVIADQIIDWMRQSRQGSCAPWCIPDVMENLLLSFTHYEQAALLHVMTSRILDREDLDGGLRQL